MGTIILKSRIGCSAGIALLFGKATSCALKELLHEIPHLSHKAPNYDLIRLGVSQAILIKEARCRNAALDEGALGLSSPAYI